VYIIGSDLTSTKPLLSLSKDTHKTTEDVIEVGLVDTISHKEWREIYKKQT
jgi:hypothetical protein